jgi:hypothetical protein
VSSHIVKLWPFVLKRTLLQEREAGDYAMSNASFWLSATRDDLKSARRELEELKAANEALNIAEWRKAAAENAQLRADLKAAADTIVRLKGGACDHVYEAVHEHPLTAINGSTITTQMLAQCRKCGHRP